MTDPNAVRVYRVNPAPPSGGNGGGRPSSSLTAWFATHRLQAALGAAGVVGAYALYRKHVANNTGATGTGTTAAQAGTNGTDINGLNGTSIAGLVSPNTSATDIENAVQDQINAMQSSVDAQLAAFSPPPAPTPPTPSPPAATPTPAAPVSSGSWITVSVGGLKPGQAVNISQVANALHMSPNTLASLNPGLAGKTTVPVGSSIRYR